MITWNKRKAFPYSKSIWPVQVLSIKDNELMVIFTKSTDHKGIYTYNSNTNKWNKNIQYDIKFESQMNSITYNKLRNTIYISTSNNELIELYLSTGDITQETMKIILKQKEIGGATPVISINNCIHILSKKRNTHYCLNLKNNILHKIHEFDKKSYEYLSEWIYLQKSRKLLVFDSKYEYCYELDVSVHIINLKWKKHIISFNSCKYLKYSTIVTILNEKKIILCGGAYGNQYKKTDQIFVYDVISKSFYMSTVRCPNPGYYQAISINDSKREELLTFGFIKKCYKENDYEDMTLLPHYLCRLITEFSSQQWVHLLTIGEHWTLPIDSILKPRDIIDIS
eukprot:461866_1